MTGSPAPQQPRPAAVPGPVRVVAGLVLLEALAVAALAVALVVALVRGTSMPGPVVFLVVLAAGIAAVLGGAARALLQGERWGRAPVMTVQILLVVLAVGWLGVEVAAWSVAVLVLAVAIGGLLVTPTVVAWTTVGARED
ncbi:hypothetical protein [Cellulomonas pakistanensis]|uniref:Uncharacterized protein n=1 Tax=Cellulomonas pakistanensis TaxID=992287 RepID=A0A919PBD6_9CELL|nr:hypothetical protein [Cellulomonas pakistanensis]GIG35147.1 hypothetical protein Cpa01nite_05280 [Cellulomonas pakistanensis]